MDLFIWRIGRWAVIALTLGLFSLTTACGGGGPSDPGGSGGNDAGITPKSADCVLSCSSTGDTSATACECSTKCGGHEYLMQCSGVPNGIASCSCLTDNVVTPPSNATPGHGVETECPKAGTVSADVAAVLTTAYSNGCGYPGKAPPVCDPPDCAALSQKIITEAQADSLSPTGICNHPPTQKYVSMCQSMLDCYCTQCSKYCDGGV